MLDFKAELDKLLSQESEPLPDSGLAEALSFFNKKQDDISLQVEEIYDLVRESDTRELLGALNDEKRRAKGLVGAVVGLCDIIDDFNAYAAQSGDDTLYEQALMMWDNTERFLEECGMARIGGEGTELDPEIHTVQAVTPGTLPKEYVEHVLRSGYRYMGAVIRKASVAVSLGMGEADE